MKFKKKTIESKYSWVKFPLRSGIFKRMKLVRISYVADSRDDIWCGPNFNLMFSKISLHQRHQSYHRFFMSLRLVFTSSKSSFTQVSYDDRVYIVLTPTVPLLMCVLSVILHGINNLFFHRFVVARWGIYTCSKACLKMGTGILASLKCCRTDSWQCNGCPSRGLNLIHTKTCMDSSRRDLRPSAETDDDTAKYTEDHNDNRNYGPHEYLHAVR